MHTCVFIIGLELHNDIAMIASTSSHGPNCNTTVRSVRVSFCITLLMIRNNNNILDNNIKIIVLPNNAYDE